MISKACVVLSILLALLLGCQEEGGEEFATADGGEEPTPTPDDDDSAVVWDVDPPDAVEGTIVRFQADCGLALDVGDICWMFDGNFWRKHGNCSGLSFDQDVAEGCFFTNDQLDDTLRWDEDGRLRFYAGGWLHDLQPIPTPNHWFGHVFVEGGDPSDFCLDWMADNYVPYPVALSMWREE